MLTQLIISNFAIISHLEVRFESGLNILSGETGAGKSIIINAVNLILGGRASADLIRSGSEEARVEALFSLPQDTSLREVLTDHGIPYSGELLIKRTISREGRNRILINGSMATLQMLSRLGVALISISGQHEHQLLLRPENHLYVLDEFGGLSRERLRLGEAFGHYQSLREEVGRLSKEIKDGEERQELRRFQMAEIDAAAFGEEEDSGLDDERKRLRHANELLEIALESYQALYEKEGSVVSDISGSLKRLEKAAEVDQRFGAIVEALSSARVELEEVALELRDIQKTITMDPHRLEEVEERLHLLGRLKRKYAPSLKEVLAFRERLAQRMDDLDQKRERLKKTTARLQDVETDIISMATALSKRRKKVAKGLGKSIESELKPLDMAGTRFEVRFHGASTGRGDSPEDRLRGIGPDGCDRVEFMLSPNVGEELRPLSRIASGGELSRIMLGLKTILAKTGSVESLVFDEVDSGIGGATAEVVGDKLESLAQYHQILCITHLPQIACKGDTHFLVKKRVKAKRAQTVISELDSEGRVKEIARLLGGKVVSRQAIAHAREILG